MKLDTAHLKVEVEKILNEEGWSHIELAAKAGIATNTIDRILKLSQSSTQRAIGRKIAEATDREFTISGDKIFFKKKEPNSAKNDDEQYLSEEEKLLLKKYREATEEGKKIIKGVIEMAPKK